MKHDNNQYINIRHNTHKSHNATNKIDHKENDSITEFLGLFNILDKHLDSLMDQDNFMPFNEKIKVLKKSSLPIHSYLARHEQRLKFIGEIRNHISHGLQYDTHQYIVPSKHLLRLLRMYIKHLRNPLPLSTYIPPLTTYLTQKSNRNKACTLLQTHKHLPLYHTETKKLLGIISVETIGKRCIKNPTIPRPTHIHTLLQEKSQKSYAHTYINDTLHHLFSLVSGVYDKKEHINGVIIWNNTRKQEKQNNIYSIIDTDIIPGLRSSYEPGLGREYSPPEDNTNKKIH